jgi:hypothetical protein
MRASRRAKGRSRRPTATVAEAGERIVQLYATWSQPNKAAEWQTKLAIPAEGDAKP